MANPKNVAGVLAKLKGYADPKTSKIEDWSWKPIEEVAARLDYPTAVPDYIQGGYGQFMQQQMARAHRGEMSPRDLVKAYGITQSSIGRGGLPYNTATKAGLKVPRTDELVRPEGAFAEWLGSTPGQRYLKAAERGEIDDRALRDIQEKFAPFGKQNQLIGQLAYGATELPKMGDVNAALLADRDRFRTWASSIKGIDSAKPGFIGSLLGRGDVPTLDARQLNLQANTPPVGLGSIMKRGQGAGGLEAVDRLTARQKALDLNIDPSLQPFYQHLTHHALWDKMGDAQTTHADLIKAMQGYAAGGKTPAWQRKEGKNPEGGLNAAGRASYNRETGGKLKAPQPEGGPRRDSFCARMKGMKKKLTSAETANDPDSRINKSLRKWKC
jgi:hypothetical protein